ncbi:hypothetical protein BJY01DRAFT_124203 [Aspergillus pseudoustus]|uniref:Mid2 domain-containing protein n=1 Tax=Aspergillus pseudoustus TaxID=1810923 RepID=A0ABR4IRZ0_9EURO
MADPNTTLLTTTVTITATAGDPATATDTVGEATTSTTTATVTITGTPTATGTAGDTTANTDAASASTTTTLDILGLPFEDQDILNLVEGSIEAVDHASNRTTIALSCASTAASACSSSGLLNPVTITIAPTTFIYTWLFDGAWYLDTGGSTVNVWATAEVGCGLVGTQTANCETEYITSYSGTAATSDTASLQTVYSAPDFTYTAVPITAGVELLVETASATTTTDSAAETGAETNSDTNSGSRSGSGSKAWIAGPVIGGLVAIAVIIGVIFFLRRRRQKRAAAEGVTPMAELPGKGVHKSELPAREPAAAELSAVKGQNQVHELA